NLSDRLEDVNAGQYEELRAINKNTKFLNESLTSATGALYSTGTIEGLSADLSSFTKGVAASAIDSMTNLFKPVDDFLGGFLGGVFGGFFGNIGGFLSSAVGAVFGGGTTETPVGYGLNIGGTAGGATTSDYREIKKETDGGWFGSDKTSYYDVVSSVDPQVSSAISKTFGYVGEMLTDFGDTLDRDVSGLVDDLKITTGRVDLTGKTSKEVQEALTQAVNTQTDAWAYEVFSTTIDTYQKLNESAFDTLSRLAIDKAIVESVITKTGQTIVGDSIALSEALINIAGGLEELTDASKTYYDAFFSEEEKQADLQSSLVSAMAEVNRSLPETSAGYRMLVESLDLSTESGKKAYVTMMKLSGNADDYYTTQLENQQDAFDAQKKLQQDALDSQIDAVNKTISAYELLSSVLSNTFDSIMGTSGTSDSMAYMSAQATLSSALTGARGGKLPELSGIQDALSVVSNNSASSYATIQSYQRDQMTTAGMVDELLGYTNSGLSVQDKMLIELQVQSELLAQKTMDITAPTAASTAATRIAPKPEYTASQIYDQLGVSYTSDFVNYWDRKGITGDALESAMEEAFKAQESSARKDKALAAFALDGSHADGLSYVPRDGYRAELHKGEAVATAKQADFFRSGELIQAISGMKVEVSQLREQVARDNVKIVANTFNAADKLDNWDVVGMPEVRV
nr:hypothetical protein [Thiomicrorhabdus sp.]